jgi:hypothetical protein
MIRISTYTGPPDREKKLQQFNAGVMVYVSSVGASESGEQGAELCQQTGDGANSERPEPESCITSSENV